MRTKIISTAVAVLIVALVTGTVIGEEGHQCCKMTEGHHHCIMKGCIGLPDFSEEQENKIKELNLELDKTILPLKSQLEVKSAELKVLLITESPDKKAIDKKIDEIGNLQIQIKKSCVNNRLAIRALLTSEQQVMFDKCCAGGSRMHKAKLMNCYPGEKSMRCCPGAKMMKMRKCIKKILPSDVGVEEIEMNEE